MDNKLQKSKQEPSLQKTQAKNLHLQRKTRLRECYTKEHEGDNASCLFAKQ